MRLFLAIPTSPNSNFMSDLWRWNLHAPLVEMGHDVVLWDEGIQALFDLDPAAPATSLCRARLGERFEAAVGSAHRERPLDLVITYLHDSHLEPEVVDRVRERVAPIVNIHQFHLVRRIAPRFTACLAPEKDALPRYREAGAEAIFFPMAANPALYRPLDVERAYDVTFAGQRYGDRTRALRLLCDAGIDAHAFGPGWAPGDAVARESRGGAAAQAARVARAALRGRSPLAALRDRRDRLRLAGRYPGALHGPVSDEEYVSLFSRSRVSLGFLVLGDTHRTRHPLRQIRLRESSNDVVPLRTSSPIDPSTTLP